MAKLLHIKILSLWEIAHYWHKCDPRVSKTHQLPLDVSNTLLVLASSYRDKVSIRVEHDKAYVLEFISHGSRFASRHYRHSFKKAIDNRLFGKRFFSKMYLSRSQLGRWCLEHKEPFPEFWFPDNDKYPFNETGDIADEITVDGRYRVQLLYDDTVKKGDQETTIVTTVSENAVKAAQVRHAKTNEVLRRFISFYEVQGKEFPSREAAAIDFFSSLDEAQEKALYKNGAAAIETLLRGLRAHLKKSKS